MVIKVKIETKEFYDVVLPVIREHGLLNGDVFQIEGIDQNFLRMLDFHSFDYILENVEGTLDGLSVRICYKDYKTFTIRKSTPRVGSDTEYYKHLVAMETNKLRPYWHIQAYILNGKLKRIGIAIKDDIIKYIDKGKPCIVMCGSQESFYSINWEDFQEQGYPMEWIEID